MPVFSPILVLAAGINLASTFIALISLGVFILAAFYIYRLSLPPSYPTPEPQNINGGLIIIALILVSRQLTAIWGLTQLEVWGVDFWGNINMRFESGQALLLKAIILLEIITSTFLITGSGFLLVLFFKTRDIFRLAFMIIVITQEVFLILDTIGVNLLFPGLASESVAAMIAQCLARWFVITLMVIYVMRSGRSQSTFVLPHHSLVSHEDPEFLTDLEEEEKT